MKYQELRDALEAGPQNWPKDAAIELRVTALEKAGIDFSYINRQDSGKAFENANFIAAANPDTLRALLAEVDAKTEALEHAIPIVETAYEMHQAACRSIRLRDAYEARYQRFKELLSQGEQT